MPGFTIVGLADAALQEARERVRGAIRNAGFVHPPRRITVNLAPAEQRKAGASLDLAIAMGILLGSEQVGRPRGRIALIGELSLGGEVRAVPGILPMAAALARRGLRRVIVPETMKAEAALAAGIEAIGVATLREAVEVIRRRTGTAGGDAPAAGRSRRRANAAGRADARNQARPPLDAASPSTPGRSAVALEVADLAEVRGQLEARRGLEIALAGGHGLLLVGPPGSGKTLLARTIPGLLPPLR